MEDQTFYGISLHFTYQTQKSLIAALLNTTLSYLWVELHGRASLGEGVLQYSRGDMAALPVLHPEGFSSQERHAIQEAFQAMASRPILPIEEEVHQADRMQLDTIVMSRFPGRLQVPRDGIVEALLDRVSERRGMAQARQTARRLSRQEKRQEPVFSL